MGSFSAGRTEQILKALQPPEPMVGPEGSRITVNDTISRFAFLYEKIRNVVDYKDEHLIRKSAIARIMKRQLLLESDPQVIADHLIRELIGARYLPNRLLPDSMVGDVAVFIQKFQAITRTKRCSDEDLRWLRGVISVEIEEFLVRPTREKAFVSFLYERLMDSILLPAGTMNESERRGQIYIACYRMLMKADEDVLSATLLRLQLPEWTKLATVLEDPGGIARRLEICRKRIQERLRHSLATRFQRAVKPWAVSLTLLTDTLLEKPERAEKLLADAHALSQQVESKTEERYQKIKTRVRRGTWRAMMYLLVTKMLFALVLEVPIEQLWYHNLNWMSLGINLSFPPVLMFLVGHLIRLPKKDNTERIQKGIEELLGEVSIVPREIKIPRPMNLSRRLIFGASYLMTFFISFSLVIAGLNALQFTWISSLIFIFFLCVVSFFAFRLRLSAREVIVVEAKDRVIAMLVDFFSIPILRAGQWLSVSISRINIFLFFFDFLFEAPFKLFLAVLEDWFAFMKEKKDEIQ